MCNEKLKFGNLWTKAAALGAEYIATGHYAIIEHHADRAVLRRGLDDRKDQSYFLFSLRQPQLQHALTPLGGMTKPEIRDIARELGLKVADKVDSQEICFVPGNDYKAFLRSHLGESEFHPGGIYDTAGKYLAPHEGIEMFTIGQRKGLPGGSPYPLYVIDIDPAQRRVVVGPRTALAVDAAVVEGLNWLGEGQERCSVKVRSLARPVPATWDGAAVRFDTPEYGVAPGQSAVFYDGERVLGGGTIVGTVAATHRLTA